MMVKSWEGANVMIVNSMKKLTLTGYHVVPKLIAIILVLVLGGPWMLNKLVVLTSELFQSISTIVK